MMSAVSVAALGLQLLGIGWIAWLWASRHRDWLTFWNPLLIVIIFFGFYFVLGPLVGAATHGSEHLGRDFTELLPLGWMAGFIGVIFTGLGYVFWGGRPIQARRFQLLEMPSLKRFAIALAALGVTGACLWIIFGDVTLTIAAVELGTEVTSTEGSNRVNYLYHTMNLLIPAALFLYVAERRLTPLLVAIVIAVIFFYAAVGFRYRIAILLIGMFALHTLLNRRSPSVGLLTTIGLGTFLVMGLIGSYRSYLGGFRFSSDDAKTPIDVALNAFNETNTFYGLSAVIDAVPARIDFAYFEPLTYIFILPIPRFLWPEKPSPEYLQKVYQAIGTPDAWFAGTAMPSVGEQYLAFGWFGIAAGSFVFGLLCRCVWNSFLARHTDPRWLVCYCLMLPFFYYMMSRGYLAQLVQDFCFTVGPALFVFLIRSGARQARVARLSTS
jgi:oligosaccharide repeat unit polymerase